MGTQVAQRVLVLAVAAALGPIPGGAHLARAQSSEIDETITKGIPPKLVLTPAQRAAIYQAVKKDKAKMAPGQFATNVGADVPPMIELYMLPDDILASNPVTKLYKYTRLDDRVVLVDPTHMRVVAVIGPNPEK